MPRPGPAAAAPNSPGAPQQPPSKSTPAAVATCTEGGGGYGRFMTGSATVHSPPDFHAVDVLTDALDWVVVGVAVAGGLLLAVVYLRRRWEDGASFARPRRAVPDSWSGAARIFARAAFTCAAEAGVVWLLGLTLGRWTGLARLFDFARDALVVLAAFCVCVIVACLSAAVMHRGSYGRGR